MTSRVSSPQSLSTGCELSDGYDTITFLTDFGVTDDFVGICHGVIRQIAPRAVVIDLTHGITPQHVTQGARRLARALPYLPVGVHLAVVDPGVGGSRRAIALRTRQDRIFVGPDNGLLTRAADTEGIEAAVELTETRFHLPAVSRTFHARDIFAPVAAHLANGADLGDLGGQLDPDTLVRIDDPVARRVGDTIHATVLDCDRYGNVQINVAYAEIEGFGETVGLAVEGRSFRAVVAPTYSGAPKGGLVVLEESFGETEIALNGGSAATGLGVTVGSEIIVRSPLVSG